MNPASPLTAEHYWSADQLRVMRGLELPSWFRPVAHEVASPDDPMVDLPHSLADQVDPLGAGQKMPVVLSPATPANDLTGLASNVAACQNCALGQSSRACRKPLLMQPEAARAQWVLVIDDGTQSAELLTPDEHRLLGHLLVSKGQSWETVCVTPLLKCVNIDRVALDAYSPPIQACLDHLQQQLALIKPQLIIAMGALSAQALLGIDDDLEPLMTDLHEYEGLPLLVLPHPAQLLQQASLKAQVWRDLNRF
jgi:uracil-DNA glycosylase